MATQNTVLSDINEIYTGYVLAGNKWFSTDAKRTYEARVKQAKPQEVADAQGKAVAMAESFIRWAKANKYSGRVKQVWWTARPGSMSSAVGKEVDQKKNPTDILVQFTSGPSNGFLGLSAKATKGQGEIGFKNPGVGTVDTSLKLNLAEQYQKKLKSTIDLLSLPESTPARKSYIRANKKVQNKTVEIGIDVLSKLRDSLFLALKKLPQKSLVEYIVNDWMDAKEVYPPYIKVTGKGNKAPYSADVMNPLENDKLYALMNNQVKLEKVGNESIGVMAGSKKIMKMRFKFESEKMASSMKLSGDPW